MSPVFAGCVDIPVAEGSAIWRSIAYIQTILKTRSGIGDSIFHTYFAGSILGKKSDYTLKNQLPSASSPTEYCEKACQRIASLIYWESSVEILSMRAEFMLDEDGRIWFVHASEICTREISLPKEPNYLKNARLSRRTMRVLHRDLDLHEVNNTASSLQKRYATIFMTHYRGLREKAKIDDISDDFGPQLTPQAIEFMNRKKLRVTKQRIQVRPVTRTFRRVNQFRNLSA